MDGDQMPKVDLTKDARKLTISDRAYMKRIEEINTERVQRLMKMRRNNAITGSLLGLGVLGIYFYTIYAVRQESFLDDFEEPQKTTN
ncbi:cytochrome c oxidase assembly factor 3, mitochondrial [Orussus abietinus]|uniref:cytochrome c oxidase assembly factor 3, mitochondrial n=1 Tax=Orussus abietinus TaxID=222816 RepID=UPI000625681A|nr:cytochrome c oxidase assembly factor 3, mitochondrial [Orussus abietinus]XP_012284909.1 cytochrome c oxidase assembly factor 3, mitochondrial [Orussus abietinus]